MSKKKYIPRIAEQQPEDEEDTSLLSADFIDMQHITPPAIYDNNQEPSSMIGIGRASKISQLMKDPYRKRPRSLRSRTRDNKKSKILANFPEIRKEIDKENLKAQEKLMYDVNVKPLTARGIKVNNLKTVYPK
jgi:hypothetical protein